MTQKTELKMIGQETQTQHRGLTPRQIEEWIVKQSAEEFECPVSFAAREIHRLQGIIRSNAEDERELRHEEKGITWED